MSGCLCSDFLERPWKGVVCHAFYEERQLVFGLWNFTCHPGEKGVFRGYRISALKRMNRYVERLLNDSITLY